MKHSIGSPFNMNGVILPDEGRLCSGELMHEDHRGHNENDQQDQGEATGPPQGAAQILDLLFRRDGSLFRGGLFPGGAVGQVDGGAGVHGMEQHIFPTAFTEHMILIRITTAFHTVQAHTPPVCFCYCTTLFLIRKEGEGRNVYKSFTK